MNLLSPESGDIVIIKLGSDNFPATSKTIERVAEEASTWGDDIKVWITNHLTDIEIIRKEVMEEESKGEIDE